jgi:uncharacterized repeat protein (TIGR02543 family)
MRSRIVPSLLLLAFMQAAFGQTQLVQDSGFESPSYGPWTVTGTAGVGVVSGVNANGGYAYDGSQYLSMGNANGAFQTAYQTITFPANLVAATLSLYYQVVSTDPNGDDTLTFYITDTNDTVLLRLGAITSASTTPGYDMASTTFTSSTNSGGLSSYAGQTVRLLFYVTTDSSYGSLTSFDIDDVSLVAGTTANIPSNDNFTNATAISTSTLSSSVTSTYASKETGEPDHAGNAGGHSLWWTWTAPSIGTVHMNTTGSSFETLLAVYTGTNLAGLNQVTSDNGNNNTDGWAALSFNVLQPGTVFQIALDGYNGESGGAVFNFSFRSNTALPAVAFTSPKAGADVTNATVVEGTATDNVDVASVWFRLENAAGTNAYAPATILTNSVGTNTLYSVGTGTVSWSALVTNLIYGPNTVRIKAVDISSNVSGSVTRVFNNVATAPLALAIKGRGAISISGAASIPSPTNGQLLDIGFNYVLTARAAAGFAFTGWTGSIDTNSAKLSFTMSSNLSFTANFVDVTPPGITVSSPVQNQRWSNSTFTAAGTAKDNVQVSNVLCQLNGGGWTPATPLNSTWSNWTATLAPLQSTNLFEAYSVDTTGNRSATNKVHFLFIPSATLALQTNGLGGVTPADNHKLLAIGTNYTLTATPAHDWIFSNWIAGGSTNFVSVNRILTFTMQSNLTLSANFVTNVFLAAQGTYHGLFAPTNAPREQTNSGAITLTVTSTGAFSGKLAIGASAPSLSGQFNPAGAATNIIARKGHASLTVALQLDFAGQAVSGFITDGSFVAPLTADLAVFNSARRATNYEGRYTFIIPGANDSGTGPFGTSWGTATVSPLGAVTYTVTLADGTTAPVNPAGAISKDGWWPFYLPLYNGNGSLWSWNCFTNGGLISFPNASWINGTNTSKTAQYRAGFTNEAASIFGSAFNPTNKPLLALTNAQVTLQGINLPFTIINQLTLASNDAITLTNAADTNKLALTINKTSGVISGTFANPSSPKQILTVSGVLLQNQTNAQGFFIGTNQNGAFLLAPR